MGLIARLIGPDEEDLLHRFYHDPDRGQRLSLFLERSPSFFDALMVEGRQSEVFGVVDEASGRLVGAFVLSVRPCFVDGRPVSVGYLGSIRIAPSHRGGRVLALLANSLRSQHPVDPPLFFCSILESNQPALNIFPSGRATLPNFRELSPLTTLLFLPKKMSGAPVSGLRFGVLSETDPGRVAAFLRDTGSQMPFFPDYSENDLLNSREGLLRGLDPSQFFIAWRGEKIVGTLAIWDQSAFRRWKVRGDRWFRLLRPWANLGFRMAGLPVIPDETQGFGTRFVSLVCIQKMEPAVFGGLLNYAMGSIPITGADHPLVAGFPAGSPLLQSLKLPARHLNSRLFLFGWPPANDLISRVKIDNLYVEIGAL